MNLFQLVLKQMRQRALSSWLTLLSVLLGSSLAIGVLIMQRESESLFVQKDFGYDIIVGVKGSEMNLVLNTVYRVGKSQGNIPYVLYEGLRNNSAMVKHAVPFLVGDTYKGYRVVGTTPGLFGFDDTTGKPLRGYDETGHRLPDFLPPPTSDDQRQPDKQYAASTFEYKQDKKYTLAQGHMFHPRKFEAVVGAEAAEHTGVKLGDKIKVAHDAPAGANAAEIDEHDEQWTVVGILDKTYTADDRVVFIPLVSTLAIPEHEHVLESLGQFRENAGLSTPEKPPATKPTTAAAHETHEAHESHEEHDGHHHHEEAYEMNPDGTIALKLARDRWVLSGILVKCRGPAFAMMLEHQYMQGDSAMAVNPATEMRKFFETFLSPITSILMILALMVLVTAAVSILVSIYNAVAARSREIAIMRALGATRDKVLALICTEAGLIGLAGGLLGLVIGHALGGVISGFFAKKMGTGINWMSTSWQEWVYLAGVVLVAVLAGLVPGMKAYRTPVATNLVAA